MQDKAFLGLLMQVPAPGTGTALRNVGEQGPFYPAPGSAFFLEDSSFLFLPALSSCCHLS